MPDGTFVEKDPVFLTWAPISLIALFVVRGLAQTVSSAAFASISTHLMHTLREQMSVACCTFHQLFYEREISGNVIRGLPTTSQISHAGVEVLNALIKDSLIVIGLLAYGVLAGLEAEPVQPSCCPPRRRG